MLTNRHLMDKLSEQIKERKKEETYSPLDRKKAK